MDNHNISLGERMRCIISDAPSKYTLSLAFFDNENGRRRAKFKIQGHMTQNKVVDIEVVINKLQWEDGSGESWCFEGYGYIRGNKKSFDVTGFFRTTDRRGTLHFV